MEGIHYGRVPSGRRLEDLSPNELRLRLYNAGVDYSQCRTKEELIHLIRNIKRNPYPDFK